MRLFIMILISISLLLASQIQAQDDPSVLLGFKGAVDDPSGTLSSWNTSAACREWKGVTCTTESTVSGLALENLTLAGSTLVLAIGALPSLSELSVYGSTFTDAIRFMNSSNACSLKVVRLNDNLNMSFVSHPVQELLLGCQGLKVLNLSNSRIGYTFIPETMVPVGNVLEVMDLSSNSFNGDLPPTLFSKCKRLRYLDLSHNNFTGELPENLTRRCTRLEKISLADNKFHGELFPSIRSLRYLESLDASFNNFTGTVPEIHKNLKHLNLSSNWFTSTTSNEICQNTSRLESLILVNNKLTGRILDRITNCSSLQMLDLSFNSLTGEIPSEICRNHPKLEYFLAWVNNFQGMLPTNLATCTNLTMIVLPFNNLTGNIPLEVFSSLKNLQWLTLSNNRLSGKLPESFEEADEILVLNLSNNMLEGNIPTKMAMSVINLRGNNFTGSIPGSINGFTGVKVAITKVAGTSLKLAAGTQTCKCMDTSLVLQGISLEEAEEKVKQKSGGCQCTLGYLPASLNAYPSSSPIFIDISYNRLAGSIPRELGSMQDLAYFSASNNFLTGTIPAELGQLKSIIGMDLSFNRLQGRIPDSFALLSSLTGLNVSYNELSGLLPQSGQFITLDPSSYTGNAGLCGFPLSPCHDVPLPNDNVGEGDDGLGKDALAFGFGAGMVAFVVSCTVVVSVDRRKRLVQRLVWKY